MGLLQERPIQGWGEAERTGRDHWSRLSSGPGVLPNGSSNLGLALAVSLHVKGENFIKGRQIAELKKSCCVEKHRVKG